MKEKKLSETMLDTKQSDEEQEREFLAGIKSGKAKEERIAEQKRRLAFGKVLGKKWQLANFQGAATVIVTESLRIIVDELGRQIRGDSIETLAFKWLLENQNKTLTYDDNTYTVLEFFATVEEMSVKTIMDLAIEMNKYES